jgi:hypothetical protein
MAGLAVEELGLAEAMLLLLLLLLDRDLLTLLQVERMQLDLLHRLFLNQFFQQLN